VADVDGLSVPATAKREATGGWSSLLIRTRRVPKQKRASYQDKRTSFHDSRPDPPADRAMRASPAKRTSAALLTGSWRGTARG
jgi:hypothetical protein